MTLCLGVHVSISGSIDKAIDRAVEIGCTSTFQIFTRNPRGWAYSALDEEETKIFAKKLDERAFSLAVAHMPYLPNLATPIEPMYNQSVDALAAELARCGQLKVPYLVAHIGSHLGKGEKYGIDRVTRACNKALTRSENEVMLLLENTAGTRNSVGSTFENIRALLNGVKPRKRVAVCFDTCHAFAAGYDLRSQSDVAHTLKLFDEIVGIDEIKAVHLNDSMGPIMCGRDRHEHIGMGYIGEKGFRAFLHRSEIRKLPLILETPIDKRRSDEGNIKKVRELAA